MDTTQEALKKRYPKLHPLLFHRSLEKANSNGELFDLLEGMPSEFPIFWDHEAKCWQHTPDILQGNIENPLQIKTNIDR